MRKLDKHILGITFWIGGVVISIINIIKILAHTNILLYDYIMTGVAIIGVTLSLMLNRKQNEAGTTVSKHKYTYGVGFWMGAGVYSLINMIMNLKNALQSKILYYNYLIIGVAVVGLIINIILLKKKRNK